VNPIKVFLSIFAFGLGLAIILGIVGLQQGDVTQEGEQPDENAVALDIPASMNGCLACHGQSLEGATGPSLINIELSKEEIINILQNGRNAMPPQTHLSAEEMEEIADYLVTLDVDSQGDAQGEAPQE
jgi:mono/diheme cytochrome c family protein